MSTLLNLTWKHEEIRSRLPFICLFYYFVSAFQPHNPNSYCFAWCYATFYVKKPLQSAWMCWKLCIKAVIPLRTFTVTIIRGSSVRDVRDAAKYGFPITIIKTVNTWGVLLLPIQWPPLLLHHHHPTQVYLMANQRWCNKVNIQLSVRGLEHINKERANLASNAGPEWTSSEEAARQTKTHKNTHIYTQSSLTGVKRTAVVQCVCVILTDGLSSLCNSSGWSRLFRLALPCTSSDHTLHLIPGDDKERRSG